MGDDGEQVTDIDCDPDSISLPVSHSDMYGMLILPVCFQSQLNHIP